MKSQLWRLEQTQSIIKKSQIISVTVNTGEVVTVNTGEVATGHIPVTDWVTAVSIQSPHRMSSR